MARADFVERRFTCCLCGAVFTALAGAQDVRDPVCANCGLRHGTEKLRRLIAEKKRCSSV